MINNVAYNSIKDKIELIRTDEIKICHIPMDIYLQEAEYMHQRAFKDLEKLQVCGISKDTLDDLSIRIDACQFIYLQWKFIRKEKKVNSKKWAELSPQAFELKDDLLHTFYYAFRNYPELISTLKDIRKGNSQAALVQNLNNLACLGLANLDKLGAVNLAKETLTKAAELSRNMAKLLAAYNSEKMNSNLIKEHHLKAFTYTKELVDEIRLAGKYVFWKDKKHMEEYASAYVRNKNKKYVKEKPSTI